MQCKSTGAKSHERRAGPAVATIAVKAGAQEYFLPEFCLFIWEE